MKGATFERKPFETLTNIRLQVDFTPWVGTSRPVTPRHAAKGISGMKSRQPFFGKKNTFDRNQLKQL